MRRKAPLEAGNWLACWCDRLPTCLPRCPGSLIVGLSGCLAVCYGRCSPRPPTVARLECSARGASTLVLVNNKPCKPCKPCKVSVVSLDHQRSGPTRVTHAAVLLDRAVRGALSPRQSHGHLTLGHLLAAPAPAHLGTHLHRHWKRHWQAAALCGGCCSLSVDGTCHGMGTAWHLNASHGTGEGRRCPCHEERASLGHALDRPDCVQVQQPPALP